MQALGDDDKANIEQTIDDEVLRRMTIGFRSTAVEIADGGDVLRVQGELTLAAATRPMAFDVTVGADGSLERAERRSSRPTGASSPTRRSSGR